MDPQDKSRFEIEGKSSVKYHLKGNHAVETKRWFWALNNAIQWAKDQAREEARQKQRGTGTARQARQDQKGAGDDHVDSSRGSHSLEETRFSGKALVPATAVGLSTSNASRTSLNSFTMVPSIVMKDDQQSAHGSYDASIGGDDLARLVSKANTATIAGDLDDDDDYGDDTSSHEMKPKSKDAFNITASSASLQLDLLAQVSKALKAQSSHNPQTPLADPAISQAIDTYESALQGLQSMISDLLKIARDRDSYWQYRLDQEADMRRLWEESMTKVAREQEQLESRIGESEEKRKRTKRVLRDVLDGEVDTDGGRRASETFLGYKNEKSESAAQPEAAQFRRKSVALRGTRRKSTIATLTELSDSDSDADEEFFDAVGAGEVEIVDTMPMSSGEEPSVIETDKSSQRSDREQLAVEIRTSFKGYEEPVRNRLKMEADDRPKISLWVC